MSETAANTRARWGLGIALLAAVASPAGAAECSPSITQDGLGQKGQCSVLCPADDSMFAVVSARGAAIGRMSLFCPAAAPPATTLECRSDGLVPDRAVRINGPTGAITIGLGCTAYTFMNNPSTSLCTCSVVGVLVSQASCRCE